MDIGDVICVDIWKVIDMSDIDKINNGMCPECGSLMERTEGCWKCSKCGFAVCD